VNRGWRARGGATLPSMAARLGATIAVCATMAACWSGIALATAPAVTIPKGPFADSQTITVSGVGFSSPARDPSGLQILECADPKGLASNLPTDPTTCDGATVNPLPVRTDAAGKFRVAYVISALSTRFGTSNIDCDVSDLCVLWVGEDYNQAFTSGPHAFSSPFQVQQATTVSGGASPPSTAPSVAPSTATDSSAGVTGSGNSAGASQSGSLAVTGPLGILPWIIGLGLLLAVAGTVVRRLVLRRSA
jgi:hypothetical protein